MCLFLIEWIHLPVVLVPYRHNLNEKAHFHTEDWNCANITEDTLCQEALSTHVWKGFSGWSISRLYTHGLITLTLKGSH